jgi:hypothetical protein
VTAVLANLGIDQFLANLAQTRKRPCIVTLHVPTETDHVGDNDRG